MNQQLLKSILFYIMIVVVIGLSIYILYYMNTQGYKCSINPMTYGIEHINENMSCICSIPTSRSLLFITKDNMTMVNP